ncbi:MAG: ribose 5-phosphate isomerase B [Syntrophomonadaceae bacterium]|nr:ribose 5-phosphate isomerase B [Syntrophomonadaceae bacterium]
MEIAIGSDHAGVQLKKELMRVLAEEGYQPVDCGAYTEDAVDYPDIAEIVASTVLDKKIQGILVCGTGIGISIAANKIPGIRAALCHDIFAARLAREHNDANILAMGARLIGGGLAAEIVKTFINTDFSAGRHKRRVEKITALENKYRERV